MPAPLTDRERQVLGAVIEAYVQTAEPAASRTIAKRLQLGLSPAPVTASEASQIREELTSERTAVDQVLYRAAQVLSLLTRELGMAVSPSLDEAVLERLELLQISTDRLLLVLTLKSGVVRTIFVEVPSLMVAEAVVH